MTDAIHFRSAAALCRALAVGEISSVDLLDCFLERVERINPDLNAIIAFDRDGARLAAEAADRARARGGSLGRLHGLPMTIKESFNMTGLPTTWGIPDMATNIADSDSAVVRKLRAEGAVLFGKTNVPIYLSDWQSFNAIHGTTNNPWDLQRTPGGSSGGSSASLAAGLTGLDAGSDIGGSVRNPAHYCGVFAHKPTHGIVPTQGHALPGKRAMPDLSVLGPLARSADDLALALDIMAGPSDLGERGWRLDLPEASFTSFKGLRVAVCVDDPNCRIDSEYAAMLDDLARGMARAGAVVRDDVFPAFDSREAHDVYVSLLRGVTTARLPEAEFEANKARVTELDPNDQSPAARNIRASVLYHREWLATHEKRVHIQYAWEAFFKDWDVLICPVAASDAFLHDQEGDRAFRTIPVNGQPQNVNDQLYWAGMATMPLLPASVAPIGLTKAGLPVGVQIIGPALGDRFTIRVAQLIERGFGGFMPPPKYQ